MWKLLSQIETRKCCLWGNEIITLILWAKSRIKFQTQQSIFELADGQHDILAKECAERYDEKL